MAAEDPGVNRSAPSDPPAWAQELLPWLVREDRAENVGGDLLEEYRKRVLPGRGGAGANRWYVGQVAGFLWRLSWVFGVAVALQIVLRIVADTLVPPDSYQLRAILSTWGAAWTYLLAGAYAGWRTQRMVGGVLVTVAAHVIGNVIAIAAGIGLYFAVIARDETSLHLFRVTGGWGEAFGLPIVVTPIVIALGVIGGFVGQLATRWRAGRMEVTRST